MRKIKYFLMFILVLILNIDYTNASELITTNDEVAGESVCGFTNYYLEFDNPSTEKEIIVIDANTSRIIDASTTIGSEYPVIFPTNIKNVNVLVNEKSGNNVINSEIFKLYVDDCGYDASVDDYVVERSDIFKLENNKIILIPENNGEVAHVSAASLGGKQENVKVNNNEYIYDLVPDQNIYHFTIKYKNGQEIYYEVEVDAHNSVIYSRVIDGLNKHNIKINISFKWLWITVIIFLLYIIATIIYKKAKRTEKKFLKSSKRRRSE